MNTEDLFKVKDKKGNDMYLVRMYLFHSILGLRLFDGEFSKQAGKLMNFLNTKHFEDKGESSVQVLTDYFKEIGLPDYFDALIATVVKRMRKYPHYEDPFDLPDLNITFSTEAMLAVILAEHTIVLDLYNIGVPISSIKQNYDNLFFNNKLKSFDIEEIEKYIDMDFNIYGMNKNNVLEAIGKLLKLAGVTEVEDLENEDINYILKVIFANVSEAVKILYSVAEWKINNIDQIET